MITYWRNLLTYLISIPAGFMCCSLMRNQFRYSFHKALFLVLAVLTLTIPAAAWADTYTDMDSGIILAFLLIACFIPYVISVKAHISKSIAIFVFVLAIMTLISSLSTAIDAMFNPTIGDEEVTVLYIVLQLVTSFIASPLLNILFRRRGVRLVDRMNYPDVWYSTIPVSATYVIVSMVVRPSNYSLFLENHTIWSYFAVVIMFIISFTALVFSFFRIVNGIQRASKTEERARLLEMQKSQFETQQRYIEESAAARHDFRQTIYTLRGLLQDQDYDSLSRYFDDYFESMPENEIIRFCLNQPLNALLNYYAASAQRSGIDLKLVIDPLEDIPVSDIDLCTVVGNILDNAVTACTTLADKKNRFIQLSVVNEGNANLFVVESNSFDGTVRRRNNRYLSVKRDGTGIGLSSVANIAASYGGSAEFSNDGSVFYSNIIIPLNNRAAAED